MKSSVFYLAPVMSVLTIVLQLMVALSVGIASQNIEDTWLVCKGREHLLKRPEMEIQLLLGKGYAVVRCDVVWILNRVEHLNAIRNSYSQRSADVHCVGN